MKLLSPCFLLLAAVVFVRAETPGRLPAEGAAGGRLTAERIFSIQEFKEEKAEGGRWDQKVGAWYSWETPGGAEGGKDGKVARGVDGKEGSAGAGAKDDNDNKDGQAAGKQRGKPQPGRDLVRTEAATGERTVVIPAQRLIPPRGKEPLTVESFTFSADGKQVLLFTNSKKVWRRNTRGDYWVLVLAGGPLRKLGGKSPAATMMFAKFSPDGTRVAYGQKNNVYVQQLSDLSITPLTRDGSGKLINGTADWVNEEELGLRDGFRWSPDGQSVLFWQFDTTGVDRISLVNQADEPKQRFNTFPYPTAGTKNSAARLGIVPAAGGAVRWLELEGDPREHYLPEAAWTPDGRGVLVHQFNRLQNELKVLLADPATGKARVVLTETDPAWVDQDNEIWWLGADFLWLSERSGWRHAYRVRLDGTMTPITQGEWDVISVTKVDEKGGGLYFMASPENATQRYLYRVGLDGGDAVRLSPADQPGTHGYEVSEDARWARHTWSSLTNPPVVDLVSLPDHGTLRVLQDQKKLQAKLATLTLPKSEFLRVDVGDGLSFDAWMLTPPDLDPARKYPLFLHVYGEPAGQTVKDTWGGSRMLWHQMLAQRGYVVASVDTRGTPGPRGRAWRKAVHRQLGVMNADDQARATRALLQRFSWLDASRVGIWGWSGGGSSSLDAIFRYPDLYQAAIAVAAVADRRLYDTIYEERYMGLPRDNEEGYREGSPLTHAKNLRGHLLLIHGTGDDNVHYRGIEKLMNELITHHKPFTVMPYPNRDHGIGSGPGTTRHLYELMTGWLEVKLSAGSRQ